MVYFKWKDAEMAISRRLHKKASQKQLEVAKFLEEPIPIDLPFNIAAARLKTILNAELDERYYGTIDYVIDELEKLQKKFCFKYDWRNNHEAWAVLNYLRLKNRLEKIKELKINVEDILQDEAGNFVIVSSISDNGRINFKGGKGFGAWPDQVKMVSKKKKSKDYYKLKQKAENVISVRATSVDWNDVRSRDLSEYSVDNIITLQNIAEFNDVLGTANDERVIQKYIEKNPHLLTSILSGYQRFCIPHKKLGSEYVPDFIIGDASSLGFRWIQIELESPRSKIVLKDGNQLSKNARKGVSQIKDWRKWIESNIDYARKKRSENGLGLFDINPFAHGFVIIGRRSDNFGYKDNERKSYADENNIYIHSYDWLLERLKGTLYHQGPPSTNPNAI